MELPIDRVKVDLEFGFSRDKADDALAILISGYYMFKSLEEDPHRFRANYPEVFATSEKSMIEDGLTSAEAESYTAEALVQYFDLLGKMIYMLGYELADVMGADFPRDEDHSDARQVSDINKEEVMSELSRILNQPN